MAESKSGSGTVLTQGGFLSLWATRKEVLSKLLCWSVQLHTPHIWIALIPSTSASSLTGPYTVKDKRRLPSPACSNT